MFACPIVVIDRRSETHDEGGGGGSTALEYGIKSPYTETASLQRSSEHFQARRFNNDFGTRSFVLCLKILGLTTVRIPTLSFAVGSNCTRPIIRLIYNRV